MTVSAPLAGPTAPPTEPEAGFSTKDILQFGASLLALLSLLLFAAGYTAVDEYCAVFGLTPEQVGIDQQTLLTRVGILTALLAALGVPLLTAGAIFIKHVTPYAVREALQAFPLAKSLALGFVLGVTVIAPGWYSVRASEVLFCSGIFGIIVFAPIAHHLQKKGCSTASLCLVALATAGLTVTPWIGDKARDSAEDLREHGRASGLAPYIGVRPALAEASWTDLDNQPQHRMTIYLGEASGMTALLPCGQQRVQRVPSPQVRLSFVGAASRSRTLCGP
ncbi:hypothetical protein [Kitasatospora sp. NPDC093806]|uniref:hypothetical protein n=1 Tax=Kitasatospora sp. NPDC093806 TaxID=3155075 RepID=UPI003416F3A5